MSDISGGDADLQALAATGALDPDPPAPDAPPDLPPAAADGLPAEPTAEDAAEWKAYGRRMAKESQDRREKYQPLERAFGNLPPESAEAILGFANALSAGDMPAAVNWLATNASALAGDDLVDQLEAAGLTRKQATAAAAAADQVAATQPPAAPAAPLTEEQARQIARDEARQIEAEREEFQAGKAHIDSVFAGLGVDPVTPFGAMVRDATTRLLADPSNRNLSLAEAIPLAHKQVKDAAAEYLRGEVARRQANGNGPVPQGGALGREVGQPIHGREAAAQRVANIEAALAQPQR